MVKSTSNPTEGAVRYVNVEQAAQILAKTTPAVRQLIARGKLTKRQDGRRSVVLSLDDVLHYYSRKKNLPALEDNLDEAGLKDVVTLQLASQTLVIQPIYLVSLIRKGELEGYIASDGEIYLSRESINRYLRKPSSDNNDTSTL